ncbi:MAG: arylsulfatase [Planctomycetota bacterium]
MARVSIGLAAALCLALGASAVAEPERPNIVLIMVDDMGYSDIGCYGGEIETPNLDSLAAEGVRFTQFHNSGRCCPTRASLMTGLHPHQVGIGHMTESPEKRRTDGPGPYQGYLDQDCATIAEVLRSAGYHTLMTGKWHLGFNDRETWPTQRGFDEFYGCLAGAVNYFKPGGGRFIYRDDEVVKTPKDWYATDAFTDEAIRYIDGAKAAEDKPFFLYLAYNAPHWPLNAKWEDYQKYRGRYREGWHALMERRQAKQRAIGLFGEDVTPAPHKGPKWDSLSADEQDRLDSVMAAYAGCIDSIDQNIGKLLAHLESIGERENTVIFFLSDNGSCHEGGILGRGDEAMIRTPPLETTGGVRLGTAWCLASNTPFRLHKTRTHEGGACTPMIAAWPAGVNPSLRGGFVRDVAHLQDFMATAIDLSGTSYPEGLPAHQGKPLTRLLTASAADPARAKPLHPEPMYWEHSKTGAMRWGDWKLVRDQRHRWELYHMPTDRTELNNLAAERPERYRQMIQMWEAWATENGVRFDKAPRRRKAG